MAKETQPKSKWYKRILSCIWGYFVETISEFWKDLRILLFGSALLFLWFCFSGKLPELWGYLVEYLTFTIFIVAIGLILIQFIRWQYQYVTEKKWVFILFAVIFFIFTFRDIGMIGYLYIVGTPTAIATTAEPTITPTVEVTPTLTSEEIVEKRVREYISNLSDDDKIILAWDMLHFEYQQYWDGDLGGDGKGYFINEWKPVTVEIAEIVNIDVEETRAEVILGLDYSNNTKDGTYKICLEYNNYKDEWLVYRHLENELVECTFKYNT